MNKHCTSHHHACDCREQQLEQALIDIIKHQELVSGGLHKYSTTWIIANRAINGEKSG